MGPVGYQSDLAVKASSGDEAHKDSEILAVGGGELPVGELPNGHRSWAVTDVEEAQGCRFPTRLTEPKHRSALDQPVDGDSEVLASVSKPAWMACSIDSISDSSSASRREASN